MFVDIVVNIFTKVQRSGAGSNGILSIGNQGVGSASCPQLAHGFSFPCRLYRPTQ
jgi:hypothetical protein